MFNYQWKNRIKTLEAQMASIMQEQLCKSEAHKWHMRDEKSNKPYVICEHCFKLTRRSTPMDELIKKLEESHE